MICTRCRGFGIHNGYEGDVVDCWHCQGSGAERARDYNGKFVKLTRDDPNAVFLW